MPLLGVALNCVSGRGRPRRLPFPELPDSESSERPETTIPRALRAPRGGTSWRRLARRGDGRGAGLGAPLAIQGGGFAVLERGFSAGMPGENEKQPGQAPEQIPPGRRRCARERSEHPSGARSDGRGVECVAVGGGPSRGVSSVGGARGPGCARGDPAGAGRPRGIVHRAQLPPNVTLFEKSDVGCERSIISEYEKSLQFDERCLSIILAEWEANPLICPVCTKSNLRVANGVVTCPCGLYLSNHFPELTEQKLRACIEDSVNAHSAHCPHTPEFSVTQATGERPTLLMSCLACDTWTAIL